MSAENVIRMPVTGDASERSGEPGTFENMGKGDDTIYEK